MLLISAFSDASGLGVNYDKSALLPTILSDNLAPILRLSPWPDLVLTTSYTHLGVLIGADVTTGVLFEGHSPKTLTGLVSAVKREIRRHVPPVSWIWTPGHCGIEGNEYADRMAELGSKKSRQQDCPPCICHPPPFWSFFLSSGGAKAPALA
jgi:hypothetical protein